MCDIQLYDSRVLIAFMCLNAVSGCLSIMGSSSIIYMMLRGGRKKLCRTQNRLIFAMSTIDILNSIALGLSYIPTPVSSCTRGLGNISTCTAQGFFLQLGMAVLGYVAMLSIHCFLSIVHNVSEMVIAEKYEKIMHAIALFPMLCVAIAGAATKSFFGHYGHCWVAENECVEDCRGFGGGKWIIICTVVWSILMAFVIFSSMFFIVRTIRRRAIKMRRWVFRPLQNSTKVERQPSMMEEFANVAVKQTLLYVFAYVLTYIPTGIHLVFPRSSTSVAHIINYLAQAAFLPLQGFWNFFIYIRPRYLRLRRERNDLSFVSTFQEIFCPKNTTEHGGPQQTRRRLTGYQRRRSYALNPNICLKPEIQVLPERNDADLGMLDDAPDCSASINNLCSEERYCSDDSLTLEDFLTIKKTAAVFTKE